MLDALAIRHLADFVRYAWPIVEPGRPLVWNWHLDIICDALERQARSEPDCRRIVICIPPGTAKSLLVSVFAPAWRWLHEPEHRALFFANDDDLVIRDSRRTREIITSAWYRRLVAIVAESTGTEPWELAFDQNQKANFENSRRGFRQCKSIGSTITGKRGDAIVIDDPLDAKATVNGSTSQVAARLEEVNNTIEVVLPSRVNDLATATWTLIMQRLHPDDPAGRALREGGWKVIQIAMEFDPDDPLNHPDDPRTQPGELMFPAKFPAEALATLQAKLGARHYGSQYQQRPSVVTGEVFRREWFTRRYVSDPLRLAASMDEVAITVDCTFKRSDASDYVVMQVWGRKRGQFTLLDQVRGRMTYPETRRALLDLVARWPRAVLKLVEEKANGAALIDDLRMHVHGLVAYDPKVSKEARAQVIAPLFEAGNVLLPDASIAPWVGEFVEEFISFPNALHDDQVDATSQLLLRWSGEEGQSAVEDIKREFGWLL